MSTTEISCSPNPIVFQSSGEVALRSKGLVKRFADVTAVDGLDLEIRAGECFGLLGPNGAGKTTTVEILEGLTAPDGGRIELFGEQWGQSDHHDRLLRSRIGVQLQETQLSDKLSVLETIKLFRSFYKSGRSADEVLRLVQLEEKSGARVGKLSGGQRQRLALACAMVSAPELLFLDEPTTGLDPQARLKLWEIVEEFQRGGGTVLLTTHYMEEAARLCDRVGIMDHGRVIALGSPTELIASLGADQIVNFTARGVIAEDQLRALAGVRGVRAQNGEYSLTVSDIGAALPALLGALAARHAEIITLTTHQATLEDVFVHLTGRMLREN